jgi:hypothetical protein
MLFGPGRNRPRTRQILKENLFSLAVGAIYIEEKVFLQESSRRRGVQRRAAMRQM